MTSRKRETRHRRGSMFLLMLSVAVLTVGGASLPLPAQASYVVTLCNSAYLYNWPYQEAGRKFLRIVTEGRGFRVFGRPVYRISDNSWWVYGYSAEAPRTSGFILAKHLCR